MGNKNSITTKREDFIKEKEFVLDIEARMRDVTNLSKEFDVVHAEMKKASGQERKEISTRLVSVFNKISTTFELDTHSAISNSPDEQFKILSFNFCEQLIKEYNCDTPSRKAIAEVATSCFIRYLRTLQLIHRVIAQPTQQAYITATSKELDRSYRGFVGSITLLKQFNNPTIELKIKTDNAFIANNQQINAINKDDKNNESK